MRKILQLFLFLSCLCVFRGTLQGQALSDCRDKIKVYPADFEYEDATKKRDTIIIAMENYFYDALYERANQAPKITVLLRKGDENKLLYPTILVMVLFSYSC